MSTGLHAKRSTGALWQRGRETLAVPNQWRGDRETGRAAYEAEREALLFQLFYIISTGARCFNQENNTTWEGTGIVFLSEILCLKFNWYCFSVLVCRAVPSLLWIQDFKKKKHTPLGVYTYVRHAAFGLSSCRKHGAQGIYLRIACWHINIWIVCCDPFWFMNTSAFSYSDPYE